MKRMELGRGGVCWKIGWLQERRGLVGGGGGKSYGVGSELTYVLIISL